MRTQRQSKVPLRYEDTIHNINNSKTTKKKNNSKKSNSRINEACEKEVVDDVGKGEYVLIKDLGDGMDNSNHEDEVLQEGESLSGNGDKGEEDFVLNSGKNKGVFGNTDNEEVVVHNTVCNHESLILNVINEVVVNDENLTGNSNKDSPNQNLNSYASVFVGFEMHINDVRYNIRRMWGKYGIDEIDKGRNGQYFFKLKDVEEPKKMPVWVKITNVPLEAWSVKGISALASNLGKPIVIDSMTASMCHKGIGNLSYARVLVEMEAIKELKNEIEIQYVDKSKNVKGSKKVLVMYD
ncbi:RNA-directed DNA polymerase, eukaryota, reverse transcriptase zinc-binding domain protein [Tanacetum coccineum]